MCLGERTRRIDVAVTENVERDVATERTIGDRQLVDRSRGDRYAGP